MLLTAGILTDANNTLDVTNIILIKTCIMPNKNGYFIQTMQNIRTFPGVWTAFSSKGTDRECTKHGEKNDILPTFLWVGNGVC